jgi:hypothetical protein
LVEAGVNLLQYCGLGPEPIEMIEDVDPVAEKPWQMNNELRRPKPQPGRRSSIVAT